MCLVFFKILQYHRRCYKKKYFWRLKSWKIMASINQIQMQLFWINLARLECQNMDQKTPEVLVYVFLFWHQSRRAAQIWPNVTRLLYGYWLRYQYFYFQTHYWDAALRDSLRGWQGYYQSVLVCQSDRNSLRNPICTNKINHNNAFTNNGKGQFFHDDWEYWIIWFHYLSTT